MDEKHNEYLKVKLPRWFGALYILCGVLMALFTVFYFIWSIYYDGRLSALEIMHTIFLLILVFAGLWLTLKILFRSATATDRGLETDNIIETKKFLSWDEIVEVRRPRFRIPIAFAYAISKDKKKLLLIRGAENYQKLIELIKEKAPNLKKCEP